MCCDRHLEIPESLFNKIYDHEILEYVSGFDIFGLLETWETLPDTVLNLFLNHTVLSVLSCSQELVVWQSNVRRCFICQT